MAASEITLKFNFSYGELLAQVFEKQAYLQRDQTELDPRGVTDARMSAFAEFIAAFEAIPEDGTMQALVSVAVENRDAARVDLATRLRDVAGVASLALGATSANYRSFQYSDINELIPNAFVARAETICDRADEFASELQTKGITAANILDIRSLLPGYKTLISEVDIAKSNRDKTTEQRRTAANNLYNDLVALAEIAKVYYQDRSEAQYNDYIIYSSSETAQTRTGRLAANEIKTRKWEALTADTEFIAENESEGELEIYFSKTENGTPATVSIVLLGFSKRTLNIATDLGYNSDTNAKFFVLKNKSSNEVVYRMRVE